MADVICTHKDKYVTCIHCPHGVPHKAKKWTTKDGEEKDCSKKGDCRLYHDSIGKDKEEIQGVQCK